MQSDSERHAELLECMVEHLLRYEEIEFLDLVQHAWRMSLNLQDLADPKDSDPLRYALKASVVERMAEIWSSPPRNIPSSPPAWCENVPPVKERFNVLKPEMAAFWEGQPAAQAFLKRNIYAPEQFMFFL